MCALVQRKQPPATACSSSRAAQLWVVIKTSHAHGHRALSAIAQKMLNVDERSMVGEPY